MTGSNVPLRASDAPTVRSLTTTVDPFRLSLPVLITGVNGFIAGHLAERLLGEGCPVRGTVRRPDAAGWLAEQGVDIVQAHLLIGVDPAAEGCGAVVHAAAWTGGPGLSPEQAWRSNVGWHRKCAGGAAVETRNASSTSATWRCMDSNRAPIIEESAATPPVGQLYPDSKIAAERSVRESWFVHCDRTSGIHLWGLWGTA